MWFCAGCWIGRFTIAHGMKCRIYELPFSVIFLFLTSETVRICPLVVFFYFWLPGPPPSQTCTAVGLGTGLDAVVETPYALDNDLQRG